VTLVVYVLACGVSGALGFVLGVVAAIRWFAQDELPPTMGRDRYKW
jgi:hypothetical protein